MSRTRVKPTDRFIAILLSFLTVLAMVPVTTLHTFAAAKDSYTVTVTDGKNAVEGAQVTIESGEAGVELNLDSTTDANGVAAFDAAALEKAFLGYDGSEIPVVITVQKDGYRQKTQNETIAADNLTANVDVTISAVGSRQASISVSVTGDAVVEVNGVEQNMATVDVGTKVPVKITPAAGAYIKTLNVGGKDVPVAKGEAYEGTITVNADIAISAAVVKEFTVTAPAVEGGTITLNGLPVDSLVVDENTKVTVGVTAAEGYQISSVAIRGAAQEIENDRTFSKEITVTSDVEVSAVFAKVYTITITHNENGTVVTDPTTVGGSVTVVKGSTVKVTADPDDNYRISEVKINGVVDTSITGENYGADDKYVKELTADKDYTIVITFAPNRYEVTVEETKNGFVSVESNLVDYNGSTKVTLTPDPGYTIESVKVNNVETEVNTSDDTTAYFEIDDIAEEKHIVVVFKKTSTASMTDVSFNAGDALRANLDGTLYVFAKSTDVTFTTTRTGIKIFDTNNELIDGKWNKTSVTIDKTTSIGRISLYYKADGDKYPAWHDVSVISKNNPLNIVIDVDAASTAITPAAPNAHGYYNSDVSVTVSTEDKGNYSGIASVEYWITNDGKETKRETLYTYKDGETIKNKYDDYIIVVAAENNSDNVVVHVKVTDRAGNIEIKTTTLAINTTKPSVSVAIDGTLHIEAAKGKYNTSRTATVTYIDRATTFNEAAAADGIVITAKDAAGRDVAISKAAMITWKHSGDTHTATISFTVDANYEWSVSYTNKADLSNDEIEVTGDSVYEFAVDTTAPAAEITLDETVWNKLIGMLMTFGLYKNHSVTAVATGSDATTDIKEILYYKSNETSALDQEQLEQAFKDGKFVKDTITVNADERFAVYARITDLAGNTKYISTDGVIYDSTASAITITPPTANKHGYYNKDVVIPVSVNDAVNADTAYSGIKSITYIVEKDGAKTQEGSLYTFDIENPTYDQLKTEWSGSITVDSRRNNSDNIKVTVVVVDNAGNEQRQSIVLAINSSKLTATVDFTDAANKMVDGHGYYNTARTATITIIDRANTFGAEAATNGISFAAVDSKGKTIELSADDVVISSWTSQGDQHTANVTFNKDGNYTWSLNYTNRADNTLKNIESEASDSPFSFTVDKTTPTGAITVNTNTWDKLLNILTFGLYSNVRAEVTATADDATSPYVVEYFETSNPVVLTAEDLDKETFKPYTDYSVEDNRQFVVYLKITDYAGNYTYINSDGYIVDKEASNITLTPSEANGFYDATANAGGQYGLYNKNSDVDYVDVKVEVEDAEPYSGIKTIDYWVENNNVKTQEGNLFTFDVKNPAQENLVKDWKGSIHVDKARNNGCNIVVYVKTVDNAGNENTKPVRLDIDITAPVIDIEFDNNRDNNGNTYFDAQRTATVTITERSHHFDADAATKGIIINAVDAKGDPVEDAYTIGAWTTVDDEQNPDAAKHTAEIFFGKDANYTWSIAYTDKAGNANEGVNLLEGTVAAFDFTVDTTAPTGTVKATSAEGRTDEWHALRDSLTFGFWSKEKITITGTSDDATSAPIASVEYYKVKATAAGNGTAALTAKDLDKVTTWSKFTELEIASDEQFTVYIKITDLAGNYTYISTNGLIVDHNAPLEETVAPEVTVTPEQPVNGIYSGDVKVDIKVTDPQVGGTYSGLRKIWYEVRNLGKVTQEGTLYEFTEDDPKQEDLLQTWTGSITVDSKLNNSNDVEIVVYALDNSLNGSDKAVAIRIDITKPTILVSYDNNSADSGTFFKDDRTATIVVTERNFDPEDVVVNIENTDGAVPVISEFTQTNEGTGNKDDAQWTATVRYTADGDYTFDIAYTDLAGNVCDGETFAAGTAASNAFTIDHTIPVVAVSYDNNDALNGNYYKAVRTATIVITEHNFNADRVNITLTATDDGAATTMPAVSGWTSNGDQHTATIYYGKDAKYTFDIAVTDKAGNASADYAAETFYVDTTMPTLTITGVANNSANKGDVVPVVSGSDTNYDADNVTITLTGANRKGVKPEGSYTDIHNGRTFTFKNFANEKEIDDIYTLTASLTDKAGNTTTETITFSVNRFGSTYAMSESTEGLNGTYVQEPIDVVITETNVNQLENIKITLFKNNETIVLKEGRDYRIDVAGGNGAWYHYTYTVFAKNFADDGVYRLTFHSEDEAGNVAENTLDTKDTEVGFGVDAAKPNIVVENLENGVTYAVENMTVKMSISDNLLLGSITVYLDDYSKAYKSWSAEEISAIIAENGEFTFDVAGDSKSAHKVKIVCTDAAGNEQVEEITGFYVTTDILVRYYNNKALFFGSIAGVFVLAGFIVFLAVYKKKKKEK